MIFGLDTLHFVLLLACAFLMGAAGCSLVLLITRKTAAQKKKNNNVPHERIARRSVHMQQSSAWQKAAKDEQLYNGR